MNLKTKSKVLFIITFQFIFISIYSQKIEVYKIDNLLNRIHNNSDTTYIVNFWATWCKPCVAELPDFERIDSIYNKQKIKMAWPHSDFMRATGWGIVKYFVCTTSHVNKSFIFRTLFAPRNSARIFGAMGEDRSRNQLFCPE